MYYTRELGHSQYLIYIRTIPEQEMDWNSLAGYDDDKKKQLYFLLAWSVMKLIVTVATITGFTVHIYNNAAALKLRGCQSFPDHWVIDHHYEINFCYAAIYSGLLLARIATHSGIWKVINSAIINMSCEWMEWYLPF